MSKYDASVWSDYVKVMVGPEKRSELEAHLALSGSAAARRTVAAFEGLLAFAARDAAAEPPAGALAGAKQLGSLLRPAADGGWWSRVQAMLVFDSAAAPLAYGIRDLGTLDRQLTYQSDDYLVDLRLEQESPNGRWAVVGQLLCERGGVSPVADVAVLATSRDRFVGRARTGDFGEFQSEGLPGADLRLFFLVGHDKCLEVPVGGTLAAER